MASVALPSSPSRAATATVITGTHPPPTAARLHHQVPSSQYHTTTATSATSTSTAAVDDVPFDFRQLTGVEFDDDGGMSLVIQHDNYQDDYDDDHNDDDTAHYDHDTGSDSDTYHSDHHNGDDTSSSSSSSVLQQTSSFANSVLMNGIKLHGVVPSSHHWTLPATSHPLPAKVSSSITPITPAALPPVATSSIPLTPATPVIPVSPVTPTIPISSSMSVSLASDRVIPSVNTSGASSLSSCSSPVDVAPPLPRTPIPNGTSKSSVTIAVVPSSSSSSYNGTTGMTMNDNNTPNGGNGANDDDNDGEVLWQADDDHDNGNDTIHNNDAHTDIDHNQMMATTPLSASLSSLTLSSSDASSASIQMATPIINPTIVIAVAASLSPTSASSLSALSSSVMVSSKDSTESNTITETSSSLSSSSDVSASRHYYASMMTSIFGSSSTSSSSSISSSSLSSSSSSSTLAPSVINGTASSSSISSSRLQLPKEKGKLEGTPAWTLICGAQFLSYSMVGEQVDKRIIHLSYVPSHGLGALTWHDATISSTLSGSLPLKSLRDVFLGKQHKIFTSAATMMVDGRRCMSLIGTQSSLHLEAKSADDLHIWLAGIKYITTHGRQWVSAGRSSSSLSHDGVPSIGSTSSNMTAAHASSLSSSLSVASLSSSTSFSSAPSPSSAFTSPSPSSSSYKLSSTAVNDTSLSSLRALPLRDTITTATISDVAGMSGTNGGVAGVAGGAAVGVAGARVISGRPALPSSARPQMAAPRLPSTSDKKHVTNHTINNISYHHTSALLSHSSSSPSSSSSSSSPAASSSSLSLSSSRDLSQSLPDDRNEILQLRALLRDSHLVVINQSISASKFVSTSASSTSDTTIISSHNNSDGISDINNINDAHQTALEHKRRYQEMEFEYIGLKLKYANAITDLEAMELKLMHMADSSTQIMDEFNQTQTDLRHTRDRLELMEKENITTKKKLAESEKDYRDMSAMFAALSEQCAKSGLSVKIPAIAHTPITMAMTTATSTTSSLSSMATTPRRATVASSSSPNARVISP